MTTTPTREAPELALLLAGSAARRREHAGRIVQLARRVPPAAFLHEFERHRLTVILGRRLLAMLDDPPQGLDEAIAHVRARQQRRALGFELALDTIARRLERADVRMLSLKGPPLARALYGDAAARVSGDLDVLIDPQDWPRAFAALAELGYEQRRPRYERSALPELHRTLEHTDEALPQVEVHWRVHTYETRFALDVLARARPGIDGRLRAAPEDELACLLLFYARDAFFSLRTVCDIGQWWDACGALVDAEVLVRLGAEYPLLAPAWAGAVRTARQVVGAPAVMPPAVPAVRRIGMARRLADPHGTFEADKAARKSLVNVLLAPRADVGSALWRQLRSPMGRADSAAPDPGRWWALTRHLHPLRRVLRWVLLAPRTRAG